MNLYMRSTKYFYVAATVAVAMVVLAGCSAPPSTSTATNSNGPSGCLVADTAGINDNGFNELAWSGLKEARVKLGSPVKYLAAATPTDYPTDIKAFVTQKCDLIVTTGFLMGDATEAAGKANPESKFAIADVSYSPNIPNIRGMVFAVDQGSFQAGFAGAAASKTGIVGTFGGVQIAPVELYMDGFARGVAYFNKENHKNVKVLGWSVAQKNGTFIGNFTDQEKGKGIAQGMMQQGADVIFPVASTAGLGAFAAIKSNGNGVLAVKGDTDGCLVYPQYCSIFLTSALKNVQAAVFTAMSTLKDKNSTGTTYVGTLKNGGTGITSFRANGSRVSTSARAQLAKLRTDLSDGNVVVGSSFGVTQ